VANRFDWRHVQKALSKPRPMMQHFSMNEYEGSLFRQTESALHHFGAPITPAELAKQFKRAKPSALAEILETSVPLGRARKQGAKFS